MVYADWLKKKSYIDIDVGKQMRRTKRSGADYSLESQ